MEAPPFDVAAMLGEELGGREGWKDVLREAEQLARELDDAAILVRTPRVDARRCVSDQETRSIDWCGEMAPKECKRCSIPFGWGALHH